MSNVSNRIDFIDTAKAIVLFLVILLLFYLIQYLYQGGGENDDREKNGLFGFYEEQGVKFKITTRKHIISDNII